MALLLGKWEGIWQASLDQPVFADKTGSEFYISPRRFAFRALLQCTSLYSPSEQMC